MAPSEESPASCDAVGKDINRWMELTCRTCNEESAFFGTAERKVRRTVTLVHGTRARHAEWMQFGPEDKDRKAENTEGLRGVFARLIRRLDRLAQRVRTSVSGASGSPDRPRSNNVGDTDESEVRFLSDQIAGVDDTELYRFCWTGKNRHSDRIAAAKDLKHHLCKLANVYPRVAHHVVAHSHGGNVALYAMHGVRALDETKVVTLGTPFLAMRPRPFPRGVLAFFLVVFVFASVIGTQRLIGEGWPDGVKSWYLVVLFAAIAVTAVSTALILGWSMLLYRKTGTESRLSELVRGPKEHPLSSDMDGISSPEIDGERILVVGAQGDEAAGLLGAAQLSSWLLASALSGLRSRRGVFLFVGIVAIVFLIGVTLGGVDSFTEIDSLGGEIVLVGGLGMLFASFLLVTAYLPFGADLMFWTLHADLTAGPLPKGTHTAFHAVNQSGEGLTHSVYSDPEAIEAVVAWIRLDRA